MEIFDAVTGWAIAALVLTTVLLPSLARGRLVLVGVGVGGRRPGLIRMHHLAGYAIAGLTLVHASAAMSTGLTGLQPALLLGVWIATGRLVLTLGQVALGRWLSGLRGSAWVRGRRLHITVMADLALAGALHIWLDSAQLWRP